MMKYYFNFNYKKKLNKTHCHFAAKIYSAILAKISFKVEPDHRSKNSNVITMPELFFKYNRNKWRMLWQTLPLTSTQH